MPSDLLAHNSKISPKPKLSTDSPVNQQNDSAVSKEPSSEEAASSKSENEPNGALSEPLNMTLLNGGNSAAIAEQQLLQSNAADSNLISKVNSLSQDSLDNQPQQILNFNLSAGQAAGHLAANSLNSLANHLSANNLPVNSLPNGAELKIATDQSSSPKRLHVSNIPFRFRDPDLRQLFGVSDLICFFLFFKFTFNVLSGATS